MNGLLFFITTLGVFNGFILSSYLFFFTKNKTLSKYLMGAMIFCLSVRIGKSILLYFDPEIHKIYLQIGLSACLFIGPFLYFYLKSVLQNIKTFPQSWKSILIVLLSFIIVFGAVRPYHNFPEFWNSYMVLSIYIVWLISVVAAGLIMLPSFKKAMKKEETLNPSEKWLIAIYTANLIIATAFFMAFAGFPMAYYITGPIVFSFFLYLLAYGFFNNQLFDSEQHKVDLQFSNEKYANKKIESSEAESLLTQLNELMQKQALYTNPKLKLKEVAQAMDIPHHRLSQLLNDNLGKSYVAFVNEYRIEAACKLMSKEHDLSLEGVGYEVGFKSKSTFYSSFKKIKALTPAQYQQQIRATSS